MQLRNWREDIRAGRPALLSGPWESADRAGHTHDPNEVTVQLDGVGREVGEEPGAASPAGAVRGEGADGPVFVDESGRRGRRYRRIGTGVGVACAVYAVVIAVTLLSGNSHAPWMPAPGRQQQRGPGADGAVTGPPPADRAGPSGAPARMPGGRPSASAGGDGATPSAGAASGKPVDDRPAADGDDAVEPGKEGAEPAPARPSPVPEPEPGDEPDPQPTTRTPDPAPTESTPPDPGPTGSAAPADTTTVAAGPAGPVPRPPA
ncbi:hypothetical protein [Streptomyces sp. MJP52]|uniref:hypothetical protein n=1 Tax=Streptomyces sp. MJP52 TaxID=2940555 RepID=UPI002476C387|nr:hypothetical protein [Streptomyces sp. MJP52]MDH6226696.1 hypothetical protein [Streptomyces sp. MJP52]